MNNTQYNVTTFTGSYASNSAFLQTQPWWGSSGLASLFVASVGSNLGTNNNFGGGGGPLYAYAVPSGTENGVAFINNTGNTVQNLPYNNTTTYVFAQATPVPAPLPIVGAAAAFTSVRRFRAMSRLLNGQPKA